MKISVPSSRPPPWLAALVAASLLLALIAPVYTVPDPPVGGLTKIKHVEKNKQVQELGRFSVGEYNARLRGPDVKPLAFVKVVAAKEQVVEGMQYYLKIAVADGAGTQKMYDAVVWDRAWLKSRQLMSFTPSTK